MVEEKKGMSKGCMIALIIVGIIALIIIALSVVCYVKRDEIAQAVMNKSQEWVTAQIKENMPENYTEAEVDEVIGNFFEAVKDGRISEDKFTRITTDFRTMAEDQKITSEEAGKLLERMKEILNEIPPPSPPDMQTE